MELCGKSLHDVLVMPENIFGLEEEEFKTAVFDISKRSCRQICLLLTKNFGPNILSIGQ